MPARKAPTKKTTKTAKIAAAVAQAMAEDEGIIDPMAQLLEEFAAGEMRVKVERKGPPPKRMWEYVGMFDLSADTIDDVRRFAGGGEYRGQLRGSQGYTNRIWRFDIVGAPNEIKHAAETPAIAVAPAKDNDAAIERMVGIFAGVTAAVTPIITLFMNRPIPVVASGGVDIGTMMKLTSDAESKGREIGERLGKLEAGGEKDRRDPMLQLADKYAGPVLSLIKDAQMKGNGTPAAPTQASPARPAIPAGAPTPTPDGYEWLEGLRPHYPMLVDYWQKDFDPSWIADGAVLQADDELRAALEKAVQRSDFRDVMRAELVVIEDEEWRNEFLERMIDELTPEPAGKKPKTKKA